MLRQTIARVPLTLCGPNESISKTEKSKFRRKEYIFCRSHFRKLKIYILDILFNIMPNAIIIYKISVVFTRILGEMSQRPLIEHATSNPIAVLIPKEEKKQMSLKKL